MYIIGIIDLSIIKLSVSSVYIIGIIDYIFLYLFNQIALIAYSQHNKKNIVPAVIGFEKIYNRRFYLWTALLDGVRRRRGRAWAPRCPDDW